MEYEDVCPRNTIFHINNEGVVKLSVIKNNIEKREYLYVHFQQRKLKMTSNLDRTNYLVIPPNRTVNMMDENITIEEMKKITKGNIFGWNFKGQLKRIMYLIYKKVRF